MAESGAEEREVDRADRERRDRRRRLVPGLLAVPLAAAVLAACGSTSAGPISAGQARAVVQQWLAVTNKAAQTKNFSHVRSVTTGAMEAIYKGVEDELKPASPKAITPKLTFTKLSVTVPCQTAATATFVATGLTNVFTLGQGQVPAALIFAQVGGTWKLADAVQNAVGPANPWPRLCTGSKSPPSGLLLTPKDVAAKLASAETEAAVSGSSHPSIPAPFALNDFTDLGASFAPTIATSESAGGSLTFTFSAGAFPTYWWPLADGSGDWVVVPMGEEAVGHYPNGLTDTLPGGSPLTIEPRPAVTHNVVQRFTIISSLIDPTSGRGEQATVDGFVGTQTSQSAS